MGIPSIPLFLLFLVPPATALCFVRQRFCSKSKRQKFQYGLPELLVLPLAATPSILAFIWAITSPHRGWDPDFPIVFAVGLSIYQVSFSLLAWAYEEKGPQGWDPAFALLLGAALGPVVMLIWFVAAAVIVLFGICRIVGWQINRRTKPQ